MANQYDLHNLELNDNQFDVVPAGSYRFRVAGLEEGFYSGKSEKIPNGTQQLIAYFDIPYTNDAGEYKIASVKSTFNVYAKALFALRQFAESIGMCKENGKFTFNMDEAKGKDGICEIEIRTSQNGNDFPSVKSCYPPSKAPKACANDKEWKNYVKGLVPVETEEDPF
jgi:hypothetical protein